MDSYGIWNLQIPNVCWAKIMQGIFVLDIKKVYDLSDLF